MLIVTISTRIANRLSEAAITIGLSITSVDTTTKSTDCTYDRIIITTPAKTDFTRDSGVFRFDTAYNLNYESTIAVLDHYPVYASFWSNKDID